MSYREVSSTGHSWSSEDTIGGSEGCGCTGGRPTPPTIEQLEDPNYEIPSAYMGGGAARDAWSKPTNDVQKILKLFSLGVMIMYTIILFTYWSSDKSHTFDLFLLMGLFAFMTLVVDYSQSNYSGIGGIAQMISDSLFSW